MKPVLVPGRDRIGEEYLALLAVEHGRKTAREVAAHLVDFFTEVDKEPDDVSTADVLGFLLHQRLALSGEPRQARLLDRQVRSVIAFFLYVESGTITDPLDGVRGRPPGRLRSLLKLHRPRGSATGTSLVAMAVAVATAASVIVLPAAPGGTAAGCPPTAGRRAPGGIVEPVRALGSWGARLSADSRYVAFASYEDDLVPGDTNQSADVFRADRVTREVRRVSLDSHGLEFQGHGAEASISAAGSRVAFSSTSQVHVRDIDAARTIDASVNDAGLAADDWSGAPVLSPDGRAVAFTSRATNLVPADRGRGSIEAYLRDLEAGTTERVSIGAGGLAVPTWSWAEAVSEGGRYVAFSAGAAGGSLTSGDAYPGADVFVRDRHAGTTEVVSVGPDGRSMGGWFLGMSADGMRILFGSGPQPDSKPAVFIRDRAARTTRLVAPLVTSWRRSAGTTSAPLAFFRQRAAPPAALSADGHLAAIQTALPTGPDDTNAADDVVLVDLATGAWTAATRSSAGCPGNGASGEPTLSHDGSSLGFTSEADDLDNSDNHLMTNVFVRDLLGEQTERIGGGSSARRS